MTVTKVGHIALLISMICWSVVAIAQEKLELYRGNTDYASGDFEQAEAHYQNALNENPTSYKGQYNLGNSAYKQEKYEEAVNIYEQAIAASTNDDEKAEAFHNLGNTHLQSGKLEESIKAYKNALRLNPTADDTRYNLAFAQKMIRQQEKEDSEKKSNKNPEDIKPSEYAKKLKAECDILTDAFQFREAYSRMQDGLKKDKTVRHYQDYITRLGEVCGIE